MFDRRYYLLTPGEGLLRTEDLESAPERFAQFSHDTGLSVSDLLRHPVSKLPLPNYGTARQGGTRAWPSLNPAMLWHPYFWLPPRLQKPAPGQSIERWMTKVGLELVAAGLYDYASGTWVDIMALSGIDVENPVDIARIEDWLAGGTDETLDAIDLEELLTGENEMTEDELAASARGLSAMAYSECANQFLYWISQLEEFMTIEPFTVAREEELVTLAIAMAQAGFTGALGADFDEEMGRIKNYVEDAKAGTVDPAALPRVLERLDSAAEAIAREYDDEAEAFAEMMDEQMEARYLAEKGQEDSLPY